MKKGDKIDDAHHVLRHIAPRFVEKDDGSGGDVILGGGFLSRPRDGNSPSVNWLDFFSGDIPTQVTQVKARSRLKYGGNSRLVRLNIGHVRIKVLQETNDNRVTDVFYDPVEAEDPFPDDPSHAHFINIPNEDDPEGEMVGDIMAGCVSGVFLAKG